MLTACAWPAIAGQESRSGQPHTDQPRRFVVERALSLGGGLDLVVNAGDVRILRNGRPDQIRVEVEILQPHLDAAEAERRWLRRMDVEASQATIHLQLPSGRSAGLVTLHVPAVTSLVVKMLDGRLTVGGVRGDKNLSLRSGTLTLREPDSSGYQHVHADVRVGELLDSIFHGAQKGFWGRTLILEGTGKYQLVLHVGAGNLLLTGDDGAL